MSNMAFFSYFYHMVAKQFTFKKDIGGPNIYIYLGTSEVGFLDLQGALYKSSYIPIRLKYTDPNSKFGYRRILLSERPLNIKEAKKYLNDNFERLKSNLYIGGV